MPEPIDLTRATFINATKDHVFVKDDLITFIFTQEDNITTDLTKNNLMGLITRVEGRYVTMTFSHNPIIVGEIMPMSLDRSMTVKLNGYVKAAMMSADGVTDMQFPLADVVNMAPSIVIKSIMIKKAQDDKANNL